LTSRAAYRRKDRGAGWAWDANAVLCAATWLICATGFAGLALKADAEYVYRADLRLLQATRDFPASIDLLLSAQTFLTEPLVLLAAISGLAGLLILRGAKGESLVVLGAFALFGVTVTMQHMVQDVPPVFGDFAPYEDLLDSNYFPSGQVVGLALLGGLVFAFAGRLLGDTMDAWLVKLAAVALATVVGPLQLYTGVHLSDVLGAYLLVTLYLLPVTYVYGAEDVTAGGDIPADEALSLEHRLPSNPAFQSLFDEI
jgi:hypothetical protein